MKKALTATVTLMAGLISNHHVGAKALNGDGWAKDVQ